MRQFLAQALIMSSINHFVAKLCFLDQQPQAQKSFVTTQPVLNLQKMKTALPHPYFIHLHREYE